MSLFINEIKSQQVLTSYNFARECSIVYAEMVTPEQYEYIKTENTFEILKNENQILYINRKLELKENDIIFCNTYFIKSLFTLLNKNKVKFKNIKVLTNQTDHLITKDLYNLKPSCVSEWYSINIGHEAEGLKPIPLGLANEYALKNLKKIDYKNININEDKKEMIYINFQVNTNYLERSKIYRTLKHKDYVFIDNPNLDLKMYINNLNSFKLILTPWGNGVDTHRIWESLYAGSIPIIKNHITFKTLDGLPVVRLRDYDDIDSNLFSNISFTEYDSEKLKVDWWITKMNEKKIDSEKKAMLTLSKEDASNIKKNYFDFLYKQNRIKKIRTVQRKILKKLNF